MLFIYSTVDADAQRVGVARLSRRAHNPETGGSNPPPATKLKVKIVVLRITIHLKHFQHLNRAIRLFIYLRR